MKTQLFRWIAILGPDRTGVSGKTSRSHAAGLPFRRSEMHAARCNLEPGGQDCIRRTARKTWLVRTVITRMCVNRRRRSRQGMCEPKCAAISMPKAIFRMDENPQRRSFQLVGAHRPLLKRLPRRIGRKIGGRAKELRHGLDHYLRPCIERVLAATIKRSFAPALKRRPDGTTDVAQQNDAPRRLSVFQHRRRFAFGKIDDTAQKNSVRRKGCTEFTQDIVRYHGTGHFGFGPCLS